MDQPGHQPTSLQTAMDQPGAKAPERSQQPWEYRLRKYLLLLAPLVVTVTYAAGFNPPGGNWQEGARDGRLAGDPIIRDTYYHRYLAFFYCNATAFAASLVVIVLILILAVQHDKQGKDKENAIWVASEVKPLRAVMVLDLLSLVGAYGAGTCRDKISTVYSAVLVATVFIYIVVLKLMDRSSSSSGDEMPVEEKEAHKKMKAEERLRKVLMLLATFAVSITYVVGLGTPGGFWDNTEGSHRPGNAILKEHHSMRLTVFLLCNTMAFVASLLISTLLIIHGKKLREKTARSVELYACIVVALVGLIGAYAAGSCRETDTTVYVVSLIGAVVAYILLHGFCSSDSKLFTCCCRPAKQSDDSSALGKARSLVLLLATLAATITYTAGLDPPGGVWQDNDNGHMAGDPILLTTNARRYKAFYYCNSVAFVASLVAIVLVQKEILVKHHVLEAAMILDLFGLIGAYAAGSCRDVSTSIYAMALAGAVLVYVVIHVVFFTLDHQKDKQDDDEDRLLEKRRKRLLLFAILAATITYQAGLTPPGGFLLQDNEFGHHAGDPVLLYNYPCRYNAFFYCNSVSFMLSIALIILLVNPNLYRPAIRSNALSVCTAVGLFCLMGAYAAGSTQHLKTSIYIFVLVAVVLFVVAGLLIVFFLRAVALSRPIEREGKEKENKNGNSAAAESCIAIEQDGKEEENKNGNSAAAESCIPIEQEGKEEVNKNGNSEAAESCMPIEQEGKEEVNKNGNSAAAESCIPIEQEDKEPIEHEDKEKRKEEGKKHARRKYLMLLGILVASVAYQAGLEPPGGAWQSSREGYKAGHPVMHDNRRPQYLAFFYSNSISFMASIVVIIMLLPHWLPNKEKESFTEEKKKELEEKKKKWEEWSLKVMNKTILLDLAALLGAYAAGSRRGWKTSIYVIALIVAVLGYFAIHMKLSKCSERHHKAAKGAQSA